MQSENLQYKSDFAHTSLKTDNIGDHVDQSPKLLSKTESNLMFQLPILDKRLEHYEATIVVQDYNSNKTVDSTILKNKKISDHLCHQYGNSWISQGHKVKYFLIHSIYFIFGRPDSNRAFLHSINFLTLFLINDVISRIINNFLPPNEPDR